MAWYDANLAQWPVPYEAITVPTRCGDTHIIASGPKDAPPLVLLHGAMANALTWVPNVAALSQTHRTYAVDILGESVKSAAVHLPHKGPEHADWLTDMFDRLGIQKSHVVGLSLGGWLAMQLAVYAPERVNRLVLMSPALFMRQNMGFMMRAVLAALLPSRRTVHGFLRYIIAPQHPVDDSIVEGMWLIFKYQRPNLNVPATLADDQLRRIHAPTLFLIGEYEVLYHPQAAVERAKRLIPNVRAEIVRNAGHTLNFEQTEMVNSLILHFLSG